MTWRWLKVTRWTRKKDGVGGSESCERSEVRNGSDWLVGPTKFICVISLCDLPYSPIPVFTFSLLRVRFVWTLNVFFKSAMRLLSPLSLAAVSRESPVAQRKRTLALALATNQPLEWVLTASHSRCLEPYLSWENNLGIPFLINRVLRGECNFGLKIVFEAHVVCQLSI